MPLRKGSSQKTISANIEQLLRDYKQTGRIGNVVPENMAHAREIAAAIAYEKAGKSRKPGKKKK